LPSFSCSAWSRWGGCPFLVNIIYYQ
jgi:hypothetical protein